ncbi:MAG: lipoyl synthase [Kangiellaceae bacterium]|jgi:lipoic acid synthetase|nr:lipoyl synthase [Kangiellaceae bacterium]|tara:strand:+ start:4892 stop:5869 length:978 start_codon:yes stop_codon:yes gene_type:complete
MSNNPSSSKKAPKVEAGVKLRGADKVSRIPVKVIPSEEVPRKPDWIRVKIPHSQNISKIKKVLREQKLHTVCEEAACPNLPECFGHGTATFMILGDICTRRCPFCDVGHGRPLPPDENEPKHLAETIKNMALKYVVITSVDRDDLRDGGAQHFSDCVKASRELSPDLKIEVLVPDFRGRMDAALDNLGNALPDVFNHNLETVPRLYKAVRPGSDYQWSLDLLKAFKQRYPGIPTKSGLMVGLGEELDEIEQVMFDMRKHDIDMITIGQYLQPSKDHLAVKRFVTPDEFEHLGNLAKKLGFTNVASGPMVRSSYHADLQAAGEKVG